MPLISHPRDPNLIKMDKQDITPSLRPEVNRTTSDLEKATVAHVERSRPGVSALEDEALMSGESQERVGPLLNGFEALPGSELTGQLTLFVVFLSFVAAVSGFCFGYDTGVISASLVSIKDDFGHILSNVEKEWISSATSIGALLG
jgi:hypothetical protein